MSGGRLVVLDRCGRAVKQYPLPEGLAALGSGVGCDIRVMQRAVRPLHANVVVHPAQTVIRNVGGGETLVNGAAVSVAALRHNDVITLGSRSLRWEYAAPERHGAARASLPALPPAPAHERGAARRVTAGGAGGARARGVALALELRHRASAPAPLPRQVAVVQPQRRTPQASEQCWAETSGRESGGGQRTSARSSGATPARASAARATPARATPARAARRGVSARHRTPLRMTVLRRAQSANKLNRVKILPPASIDRTKRAAIMLMTGHTPKSKLGGARETCDGSVSFMKPSPADRASSPVYLVSNAGRNTSDNFDQRTITILDITDSTQNSTARSGATSAGPRGTSPGSPPLPGAGRSAMRNRAGAGPRKSESIKFDLSNLRRRSDDTEDATLRYSESSGVPSLVLSPSPRRPLHPRARASGDSYSVVDLVSLESERSTYDSVASGDSASFDTARDGTGEPVLLGCSTPYAPRAAAEGAARRARRPRSRSRINDTLDDTLLDDESPRSSRRVAAAPAPAPAPPRSDAGTPVLSIRSLLQSETSSHPSPSPPARATPRRSVRRAAPSPCGTPRGGATLEPEAVKNKHSSAKRPQSRRSIIDDLDSSDIVKQLFNSPVKRKLSRSMTEFPRERSPPSPPPPRRPARHTLPAGTLDSVSDRSDHYTPERFVSPIDSPRIRPASAAVRSPAGAKNASPRNDLTDVRGVRSLFRRKSPENDLTNVSGVKRALRNGTPRNDLGDVRGVGNLFRRKSAKNDLRDVSGVPRVLRNLSPRNDLRDVRGVRGLFRQKSPENDLGDVGGVGSLFRRKSPENDLRNVSGARRALTRGSPNNDLRDVRGVKRLFAAERPPPELQLSGVAALLGGSSRAEALFDALPDAAPRRAVYSRSLPPRAPRRAGAALHASLAGAAQPEAAGRERRLPLKKRSLGGGRPSPRRLPLKKRAVVHSTPVKGRLHLTMNASELGRVSPIRALPRATDLGTDSDLTGSTRVLTDEPSAAVKPRRTPRKQETPRKISVAGPEPPRAPPEPPRGPEPRRTRARADRAAVVVTKLSPKMKPRVSENVSPPKLRRGRANVKPKEPSPEKTRATRGKKQKETKPSADETEAEPAPARRGRKTNKKPEPVPVPSPPARRQKRGRKNEPEETIVPEKKARVEPDTKKRTRARNVAASPAPAAASSKRTRVNKTIVEDKPTRATRKPATATEPEEAKPRRGRTRGTAGTTSETTRNTNKRPAKDQPASPANKRGRRNNVDTDLAPADKTTTKRNKAVDKKDTVQPEKLTRQTRGRKVVAPTNDDVTVVGRGRRKAVVEPAPIEEAVPQTRSRGAKPVSVVKPTVRPKPRPTVGPTERPTRAASVQGTSAAVTSSRRR